MARLSKKSSGLGVPDPFGYQASKSNELKLKAAHLKGASSQLKGRVADARRDNKAAKKKTREAWALFGCNVCIMLGGFVASAFDPASVAIALAGAGLV